MLDVQNPKSILVIHVTRIGDTLLTTPVLRAIKKRWPNASLTFVGHPNRAEVIQNLSFVDKVICMTKNSALLRGRFQFHKTYDLAFVIGHDLELIKLARRVSHHVVGWAQNSNKANALLDVIANPNNHHPGHAVKFLLQILEPFDIEADGLYLSYCVTPAEQDWANEYLLNHKICGRPLIGLQVASFPTKSHRDWPIEKFLDLCLAIRKEFQSAHFLILGGTAEVKRTNFLHDQLQHCSSNLAGKLSLRQTAALMNRLDLYIGVDTGPTHIMGALHRPLIAMYHPTVPSKVLGALEHPCFYPIDHPALGHNPTEQTTMSEISVETILQTARKALASASHKQNHE